jgi:hypothetical protein
MAERVAQAIYSGYRSVSKVAVAARRTCLLAETNGI